MARSVIRNTGVKQKVFNFTNLGQYTKYNYYLQIPTAFSIAGIPAGAIVIGLGIRGWSGLGSNPGLGFYSDTGIYVFYTAGQSIGSSSYITVQISYI